ncbi:MAG: glutathione peroxidase, partial [Burkholderiales bacterium]|nr:glutathione peroxidase [Burkholderiales bacterium]
MGKEGNAAGPWRTATRRAAAGLAAAGIAGALSAGAAPPSWAAASPGASSPVAPSVKACPSLLDHVFPDLITGKPVSMCQFRGKVLLVVNTASECGFTPQYEQLEAMHRKLSPRGLVIVGFPSNDFQQERGSSREIAEFCKLNYGVSFPMFEPSGVSGRRANPFY